MTPTHDAAAPTGSPGQASPGPSITELLDDLSAERFDLCALVEPLDDATFATPTPAPGWTIRDQVAHLAFFDGMAALAITDPDSFRPEQQAVDDDEPAYQREHLFRVPAAKAELLSYWTGAADRLAAAVVAADPAVRVPWYGPAMALRSFVTARIMETWAHGQDVADALGARRPPTERLRHVAMLAVRARPFSYHVRELEPNTTAVRVELTGPAGDTWTFGPADADEMVTGSAEEFCLVLTRRRHVDDTALRASGPAAREWLLIGQAYAGSPGDGPMRRTDGHATGLEVDR
ncbi:TIGR03084 family metal-binding protein [Mycolicibacterium thermoresistibile]